MSVRLSDAAYARLRDKHIVLAEVIDSDREIEDQRRTGVIQIEALKARRERVRTAAMNYGFSIRGNGTARD